MVTKICLKHWKKWDIVLLMADVTTTGNQYLEETGKASSLKNKSDLYAFIEEIKGEASYEQMSLF